MDLSEKILSRLKLRRLRVIVAIEDYSSLRGAAEYLGLSPPAITKTVQEA
jgi:DNA-binding transcriptional LysR family regulator